MSTGAEKTIAAETAPPAPTEAPPVDLSGRTLKDFHILRRLGQGGMGQVYLAEQLSLKRRVALKVLKVELAANPTSLARFRAEAEAVARATHANIVQVYDVGEADGFNYMALEYVEGRNLRDYVARKGPPEPLLAISIMRQVAAALERAGELGIIHRDIKPENILLTRKGEVKVADFGLSRCLDTARPPLNLTQTGVTMGTPLYMSPEQVEGKPLDVRTDIYSFGVTCYHMLAGQPPFRGQTAFEVAIKHVRDQPEPLSVLRPDLPPELCAVVHKMMAKNPQDRYQTCGELLRDLARLRESLRGRSAGLATEAAVTLPDRETARPESVPQKAVVGAATGHVPALPTGPTPVWKVRRWLPLVLAATVLAALAGGAGLGWLRVHGEPRSVPAGVGTTEPAEVNALLSEADREKFLLTAVEQYATSSGDVEQVRIGVAHNVELAVFYLERRRLDDADRFFARLEGPGQPKAYRTVGRLGRAIVLALRDKADESNEVFKQFLRDLKGPEAAVTLALLNGSPKLRMWVGKALDHNAENATPEHPFPKELEVLRKPSPHLPLLPPRRPEKPGGRPGS